MKDCIKVAQELNLYFSLRRNVGHTRSAYKGNDESIYVVSDDNIKRQLLEKYGKGRKIITINDIEAGGLVGVNKPIVIDHFVFQILVSGLLEEILKLKEVRDGFVSKKKLTIKKKLLCLKLKMLRYMTSRNV